MYQREMEIYSTAKILITPSWQAVSHLPTLTRHRGHTLTTMSEKKLIVILGITGTQVSVCPLLCDPAVEI